MISDMPRSVGNSQEQMATPAFQKSLLLKSFQSREAQGWKTNILPVQHSVVLHF